MKILHPFKYNIDAILRLIILLGFAIFLLFTLLSGKAVLYVHPRINPYLIFAIIAMTLISVFLLKDVFKPQRRRVNWAVYLFFIIPLLMAFTLPAKPMDSSSMSYDVKIGQQPTDTASSAADGSNNSTTDNSNTANVNTPGAVPENPNSDLKLLGDTVILEDKTFVRWLQVISDNMGYYDGKKIQLTGFVFKDKQFGEDEFVPARLMMVCCAADLSPIGLLCKYNKASDLKKDTWVKVTGTIKKTVFQEKDTLMIQANSVENTAKPLNEYVYPY